MPRNFARHEQFLRIFALLETLFAARQALDDHTLIDTLKQRLGIKELSVRTLHRDCDFLASCGYPIDHVAIDGARKQGWLLDREALAARKIPAEPLTTLELVAFTIGRELLRPFDGTVLWTGIESLWSKLRSGLSLSLLERLEATNGVFHVVERSPPHYGARPRRISMLSRAISDCRELDVTVRADSGRTSSHRLRPLRIVIEPPRVRLLAWELLAADEPPVVIDLEAIDTVTPRDTTFSRPVIDVEELLGRAVPRP